MRHLLIITILASLFSGMAFAAESKTDCPMMREMNRRNNPKANLKDAPSKQRKSNSSNAISV